MLNPLHGNLWHWSSYYYSLSQMYYVRSLKRGVHLFKEKRMSLSDHDQAYFFLIAGPSDLCPLQLNLYCTVSIQAHKKYNVNILRQKNVLHVSRLTFQSNTEIVKNSLYVIIFQTMQIKKTNSNVKLDIPVVPILFCRSCVAVGLPPNLQFSGLRVYCTNKMDEAYANCFMENQGGSFFLRFVNICSIFIYTYARKLM